MVRYAKNLSQAAELRAVLNSQSIEFDLLDSQGAPIPSLHLSKLKSAAQLLSITSVQALHETNRAEAWSNITAEAEFLRSYRGDPLMISDLVRVATAIIAITATWDALQEDCWTEQQLSELQARWEAVSFTNQLEAVVRMERAFGIASLEEARKMTYQQSAQSFYSSARSRASDGDDPASVVREDLNNLKGRYLFWRWKYSGSFDTEEYNIRSANAALVCSRLILTSGAFLPALHGLDEEATRLEQLDPAAKSSSGIYRYAADMFRRYFERMAAAEAARELVITAIALKRYHLQRSSYPENLNALVPAFLRAVPKDPWDGKSLRYRTLPEGGFVLYSVGKDGEDNGGDATPDHTGNPAAFDFVGKDFLWPRLATPAEVEQYRAKTNRGAAK
jgi:hypothetical protein